MGRPASASGGLGRHAVLLWANLRLRLRSGRRHFEVHRQRAIAHWGLCDPALARHGACHGSVMLGLLELGPSLRKVGALTEASTSALLPGAMSHLGTFAYPRHLRSLECFS